MPLINMLLTRPEFQIWVRAQNIDFQVSTYHLTLLLDRFFIMSSIDSTQPNASKSPTQRLERTFSLKATPTAQYQTIKGISRSMPQGLSMFTFGVYHGYGPPDSALGQLSDIFLDKPPTHHNSSWSLLTMDGHNGQSPLQAAGLKFFAPSSQWNARFSYGLIAPKESTGILITVCTRIRTGWKKKMDLSVMLEFVSKEL